MKAIEFLRKNKISDYTDSEKKWFDEYQNKIIELYSRIELLMQDKNNLSLYKDIYHLIKYFENKHEEADIKISSLGSFYKYNDEHLFLLNPTENDLSSPEYVFLEISSIKDGLDKDIQENKDYLSLYFLDFNLFMCNYSLLNRIEDKLEEK